MPGQPNLRSPGIDRYSPRLAAANARNTSTTRNVSARPTDPSIATRECDASGTFAEGFVELAG